MDLAAKEKIDELFPLAAVAPDGVGFVFSNRSLPETRVPGSNFENAPFIGTATWLSSTSRWTSAYSYGTTAVDSPVGLDYADQRYYASTYGNFTSPDPSMYNVNYKDPLSWNAYAYTTGDPINSYDSTGLDTITVPTPPPGAVDCETNAFGYSGAPAGETVDQLFNSNQGVMATMSYFEQQGSGTTADQAVWAALDWTMENLYSLPLSQKTAFYGLGNVIPISLTATVVANSQVFSNSQLLSGFNTQLNTILLGSVDSTQCNGLISAFNVAAGVISAAQNVAIPGITPIPNPVPGALQFGSNGAVPTHSSSFTQGTVGPPLLDRGNTWTFYSETPNSPLPPPVRQPPPPRGPRR